ncbi:uncharacterized protein LOC135347733 [Halichondria panicea]|uniref:uncharacterized protein LOC135347733 n=1 Tax=Halichondria panicea TaxID=6063 RepID=UPI00312BBA5F
MSAAESSKPRVNTSMLSKHIGSRVCLVGKNLGVMKGGTSLNLEASDKQTVTANFPQPLRDPLDTYVELLGKVENDCSISVERIVNFGNDFDLDVYNEVIQITSKFPSLFPQESQEQMQY